MDQEEQTANTGRLLLLRLIRKGDQASAFWFLFYFYLGAAGIIGVLSWMILLIDGQGAILMESRKRIIKYLICTTILWPIGVGAFFKMFFETKY